MKILISLSLVMACLLLMAVFSITTESLSDVESNIIEESEIASHTIKNSHFKQSFDLKMESMLNDEVALNKDNTLEMFFDSTHDQSEIKIQFQPSQGLELLNVFSRVKMNGQQFKEKIALKVINPGRHYLSIIATTTKDQKNVFKTFSIPIVFGKVSKKKDRTTIDANGNRIISLQAKSKIK